MRHKNPYPPTNEEVRWNKLSISDKLAIIFGSVTLLIAVWSLVISIVVYKQEGKLNRFELRQITKERNADSIRFSDCYREMVDLEMNDMIFTEDTNILDNWVAKVEDRLKSQLSNKFLQDNDTLYQIWQNTYGLIVHEKLKMDEYRHPEKIIGLTATMSDIQRTLYNRKNKITSALGDLLAKISDLRISPIEFNNKLPNS